MSTSDVAAAIGRTPKTVLRWTKGETVPSALDLGPLSEALGVRPLYFLEPPPVPDYPLEEFLVRREVASAVEEAASRPRRSDPEPEDPPGLDLSPPQLLDAAGLEL